MHPLTLTAAIVVAALAALLPAQTYVVDAAGGGPGVHFADIQVAVNTVPDGAVLLVRPGIYASFTISGKGLTVLGELGAAVHGFSGGLIQVQNTSPSQRVVVRDFALGTTSGNTVVIRCQSCQGPVLMQRIAASAAVPARLLAVTNCSQVLVDSCGPFQGSSSSMLPVYCQSSKLTCIAMHTTAFTSRAVYAFASQLQLVGCTVLGGSVTATAALPAIELDYSSLRLAGGGSVTAAPSPAGVPMALAGTGTVQRDPSVSVGGSIASTVTFTMLGLPAVIATAGLLSSPSVATLVGPSGQLAALMVGPAHAPTTLPPGFDGAWWLDPASTVPMVAGVLGSSLSATMAVPANPLLLGTVFGWQGLTYDPAFGFRVTNAAWFAP